MDNILIISDFPDIQYKKDSGTPAFRLIVEALAKKYVVHIVAPDGEGKSKGNIVYHRVPVRQRTSRVGKKIQWVDFVWKAGDMAEKVVEENKPRIVYGAGCASSYVAGYIGSKYRIPSVARLFGTYLYPYLNNPISLLLRFEESMAFASPCTCFVITNDGTRGDAVANYFSVSRLCFWRNGVEVPKEETIFPSEIVRVISMARLEKWKRVDRIIEAFAKVAKGNMILAIVGDGPERHNLERMVCGLDLQGQVKFYGELPRVEALQMLALSDIFITTNDYSNVSNSLMEAMIAGKAVIALDTGGTSEVVMDLRNGVIAKHEWELSGAIQLCYDPVRRKIFGDNAKKYAQENFESWEKRIDREVSLIGELIS